MCSCQKCVNSKFFLFTVIPLQDLVEQLCHVRLGQLLPLGDAKLVKDLRKREQIAKIDKKVTFSPSSPGLS